MRSSFCASIFVAIKKANSGKEKVSCPRLLEESQCPGGGGGGLQNYIPFRGGTEARDDPNSHNGLVQNLGISGIKLTRPPRNITLCCTGTTCKRHLPSPGIPAI